LDIKAVHEELGRVWLVAQRMWQRDWPAVHVALNTEWSDDIKEIMISLKCELIKQMKHLCPHHLEKNVTTLSIDGVLRLLNFHQFLEQFFF